MPGIHTDAKMDNLDSMIAFLSDQLDNIPFSKNEKNRITLACEEVLVNIITHAYGQSEGDIRLDLYPLPENSGCRITVRDRAPAFNPMAQKQPDTSLPPESRDTGGLGIFLTKKNMDKISYVRDGEENRLIMTKWVNGGVRAEDR